MSRQRIQVLRLRTHNPNTTLLFYSVPFRVSMTLIRVHYGHNVLFRKSICNPSCLVVVVVMWFFILLEKEKKSKMQWIYDKFSLTLFFILFAVIKFRNNPIMAFHKYVHNFLLHSPITCGRDRWPLTYLVKQNNG